MKDKKMDLNSIMAGISRVDSVRDVSISILSILLALLVGALLILLIGESPLEAYKALFDGAFGSSRSVANTLSKSVPLIFTGLAIALASRCGLLNMGAEGQLHVGGLASAVFALRFLNLPWFILIPSTILAGALAGAVWGGLAGILKAKFKINEVIVTIMTNYIAILFTSYLVNGPFKAVGSVPQTDVIPEGVRLNNLIPRTQLTTALFIALAMAILVYWFLWKTPKGYELRAVGENPSAAEAGGINIIGNVILAMVLSGGIAALAGITEVMGTYHRFIEGFSPDFGFTGVAVAMLGRNHPVGIVFTALLFGALDAGALRMDRVTSISADMVVVIQGLVILFVAMPEIIKILTTRKGKDKQ